MFGFAKGYTAFMCFYDAERVLSAIAKFLFTSLGKGRVGVKWEKEAVGKESGKRTGS